METNDELSTKLLYLSEFFAINRVELVSVVYKALYDVLYSHRSFLRPNKLKPIAEELIGNIEYFLNNSDENQIQPVGTKHVNAGVSVEGAIRIWQDLSRYCYKHFSDETSNEQFSLLNLYQSIYLQMFIATREQNILNEQEHIRHAMQRSLSHNNLWLQTAAEVSRAATSTLNLNKLLSSLVTIVRKYFDFYHVGIFLTNKSNDEAILLASKNKFGESKLKRGYKVNINNETLIGKCLKSREFQIVRDLRYAEHTKDWSILEETKSALALPLISRNEIIGGLFIQSTDISTFGNDDIIRLQTVADQITNAIQNARLYHELEMHNENLAQSVLTRTNELQRTKERVEAILDNSPDGILLIGSDGTIEQCNTISKHMFGYTEQELTGKSIYTLIDPERNNFLQEQIKQCIYENVSKRFQITARKSSHSTFQAGVALASVKANVAKASLVCSIRDISEAVEADLKIKSSLREKEVLLREIHHRVKNNLQVISSLLDLQAGHTDNIKISELLLESQNRVKTMALIHERLYQSRDLAQIDFGTYLHELTTTLFNSYVIDQERIHLNILADVVHLDIERAIPCGLIINELVSNALKHAFPNNQKGTVYVEINKPNDQQYAIIVGDNGVGMPEDLVLDTAETLGLQLIVGLALQLDATIGLMRKNGTQFEIRFAV